jgi:shikimate dehydrogenase
MIDDVAGDPRQIFTGGFASVGRYAVIGHPVEQSLSPQLHNAWFRSHRVPGTYEKIDVAPAELVRRGPSLPFEFAGLNVTIPHKVAILGYASRIDPDAKRAGAANVLYRDEDKAWTAGNTDGSGFIKALEEATGEEAAGRDVVILGAGGAARAIGAELISEGAASVVFLNRTEERARDVTEAIGATGYGRLHPDALDLLEVSVDLLVNTLPVEAETLIGGMDLSPLPGRAVVADINYHRGHPALLRRAAGRGLQTVDGAGMFLWQAALSFQAWTGVMPDLELGRRTLTDALDQARPG